jgi:hypothetical protein
MPIMGQFFAGVGVVFAVSTIMFLYLIWRAPLDTSDEQTRHQP